MDTSPLQVPSQDYSYTGPPWTLVHYRYLPKITSILALHGHQSITGTFPRLQLYWPSMDTSPLQVPSQDYSYTGPPWTLVHYRYLPNITAILALHGHQSITGTFPRLQLYWPSMDTSPLQVPSQDYSYTGPPQTLVHYRYLPKITAILALHGDQSITGTFPRLQLYWPSMDTSPLQVPSQDYSYTGPPWTLVHYRYLPKITAILALHRHQSITGTFPRLQLYWPSVDTSPLQVPSRDYSYSGPPWTLVHYRYLPKITAILALHGHQSITGTFPRLQLYWPSMDTSPLQVPSQDYSYTGPPWTLVHHRYLPNSTAILALHGHQSITGTFPRLQLYWPSIDTSPLQVPSQDYSYTGPPWTLVHYRYLPKITAILALHGHQSISGTFPRLQLYWPSMDTSPLQVPSQDYSYTALHGHQSITGTFPRLQLYWPSMDTSPLQVPSRDYRYTGPPWTLVHYRYLPKIIAILALHGHQSITGTFPILQLYWPSIDTSPLQVPSRDYSCTGPPWILVSITGTFPRLQLYWPSMDTSPLQVPSQVYSYTGPPWTLVHYRYLPKITAILALHRHQCITGTFPRLQLYWPSIDTSPLYVPSRDYSYTGPPWTLVHYRYLPKITAILALHGHQSITGTFPRVQLYWPSVDTSPLQVPSQDYSYTGPPWTLVHHRYLPNSTAILALHGHQSITGTFPRLQLYWPSMDTSPSQVPSRDYSYTGPPWTLVHYRYLPKITAILPSMDTSPLQVPSQDYSYTGPPWTLVHYRYLPEITGILALHGHQSITGTFPRLQLYWPSMDTSPLQVPSQYYSYTGPPQTLVHYRYLPEITAVLALHGYQCPLQVPSQDYSYTGPPWTLVHYRYLPKFTAILALHGHQSITGTFPRLQLYWPSIDTSALQVPSQDYSYTGPPQTLVHYMYLPEITAILALHGHQSITGTFPRLQLYWPSMDTSPLQVPSQEYSYTGPPWTLVHYRYLPKITAILALHGHQSITGTFPIVQLYWLSMDTSPLQVPSQDYSYTGPPWTLVHYRYLPKITAILALHGHQSITGTFPRLQLYWPSMDTSPFQVPSRDYSYTGPPWTLVHFRYLPEITAILALHGHQSITGTFPRLQLYWPSMDTGPLQVPSQDYSYTGPPWTLVHYRYLPIITAILAHPWTLVHYRYLPKITAILALHGHQSITGTFPLLQLFWPSMDTSPLQLPSQDYSYTGPPWTLVHYSYLPKITAILALHRHQSITGTFPRLQLYWPSMDTSPLQVSSQDYSYTGPPWTLVHYSYLPKIIAILALHGHQSITVTFPRLQLYWPSMDTSPLQLPSQRCFSPSHLSVSTLRSVPARIMTCQCLRSSAISVVISFLAISSFTRSPHLSFGLPRFRFPSIVICNIFLVASSLSRPCTCPTHLNLFSLRNSAIGYMCASFQMSTFLT